MNLKEAYELLKQAGVDLKPDEYRKNIATWKELYAGDITGFHKYTEYNGNSLVTKRRRSLKMGKKICEDWADSLFNDNVDVSVGEGENDQDKSVHSVLDENNFREQFTQLLEKTFALGTGAMVEYVDAEKKTMIDYIVADMVFPLKAKNGRIIDCAFVSMDETSAYVNVHRQQPGGSYEITNVLFEKQPDGTFGIVEDKNIREIVISPVKLFQIIRPNLANNLVMSHPMGLSVLANAWDELRDTDTVYDSLVNEIDSGKRRIFVKVSSLTFNVLEDGSTVPIFDPQNTTFYQIPGDDEDGQPTVQDVGSTLRVTDHNDALQTSLNLLGRKVGLGDDYYSFKDGAVYTNTTQVVSSNSKFYKTLKKHEMIVGRALKEMVKAILYLQSGVITDVDVSVSFDDSIVEDMSEVRKQAMLEFHAGLIDAVEYHVRVSDMTIEQAIAYVEEMNARKPEEPEEEEPEF